MLTTRIIPCLDVDSGRVVKGVRFQGMRDVGSPAELGQMYERQGADEMVILDVSATQEGRGNNLETVQSVRQRLSIPLTVGGGVRSLDDAGALLDAGADKISLNSAAVANPGLVAEVAGRFGRQCTVVAVDARRAGPTQDKSDGWKVVVQSGTRMLDLDVLEWVRRAVRMGAGEILLTSWDRDGTRSGYDLDLIWAVSNAVSVPVIASGGGSSPSHLADAIWAGADAVLAASIFHDGEWTVGALKGELKTMGVEVRL